MSCIPGLLLSRRTPPGQGALTGFLYGLVLTYTPVCPLVTRLCHVHFGCCASGAVVYEPVTSAVLSDAARAALERRVPDEEQQQQQEGYYFEAFKRAVYTMEGVSVVLGCAMLCRLCERGCTGRSGWAGVARAGVRRGGVVQGGSMEWGCAQMCRQAWQTGLACAPIHQGSISCTVSTRRGLC